MSDGIYLPRPAAGSGQLLATRHRLVVGLNASSVYETPTVQSGRVWLLERASYKLPGAMRPAVGALQCGLTMGNDGGQTSDPVGVILGAVTTSPISVTSFDPPVLIPAGYSVSANGLQIDGSGRQSVLVVQYIDAPADMPFAALANATL